MTTASTTTATAGVTGVAFPTGVVNMSRPSKTRPAFEDPLLDHLKDRFDQVRTLVARRSTFSVDELLKDLPQPTAEDRAAYDREEARREHRRQHDPILREAEAYSMLAHAWFETERDGMRSHADALVRRAEMEHVDDISLDELARIVDAIEIVRNACFLIYVKLRRAGARGSARGAADGGGAAPAAGARVPASGVRRARHARVDVLKAPSLVYLRCSRPRTRRISSSGTGKRIVEFCSDAISVSVCR
jgi:hypothetical protein